MGDDSQFCFSCCLLLISAVAYLVQTYTADSHFIPPSGHGVVPNGTTPATCAWDLHLNNRTYIMECGGTCKKKCGVCDPQYDGCIGTKYCPVKCHDGSPCLYRPGTIASDCTGVCDKNNICIATPPAKADPGEYVYHGGMTIWYLVVFVSSYALARAGSGGNGNFRVDTAIGSVQYTFALFAFVFFIISGSFYLAVVADTTNEHLSVYHARLITMSVFYGITWIVLFLMANAITDEFGPSFYIFVYMWVILGVIEIMQCAIGEKHAILYTLDEPLHPFVAENRRCSDPEYYAYVGWVAFFGVLLYTFANLSANHRSLRQAEAGVMEDFFGILSIPGAIIWLVCVAFYGACKNNGFTLLTPFGITITAFYLIFIAATVHYILEQRRLKSGQGSEEKQKSLLPEKYPDAENPHDSIYGTDDATDNNMEAPDAEGRVDRILRRLHGYEHTCFSYCTPSMFLVMFFVAEYLLVCWVMYTVRGMIVAASSASHGGKG